MVHVAQEPALLPPVYVPAPHVLQRRLVVDEPGVPTNSPGTQVVHGVHDTALAPPL